MITLGCRDRTGVVAKIASFLSEAGGWIVEASYHTDHDTGWFFIRQEVLADSLPFGVDELRAEFAGVASELETRPDWRISDTGQRKRVVVLVSREAHCRYDLLGRIASGELDVAVPAVIGDHSDLAPITRAHGIAFHHVPVPASDPEAKEVSCWQLRQLVDAHHPDAVVLAKFLALLPGELCAAWQERALTIHHSFLPSFTGAHPYHQAHHAGVKLVGATCHYVTAELDAGPIIEQDVTCVENRDRVADLVRKGRDVEKAVLARSLRWHLQDQVLVHGNHTVVL